MCWFTLHTAATAGAETDGIQELHSGLSPTWVQGSKHIGHFVVLSQSHLQGSAQEVQQLGLESVPKCDATITDSQTCYATSPGPKPAYSTRTSLNSDSLRFLEGNRFNSQRQSILQTQVSPTAILTRNLSPAPPSSECALKLLAHSLLLFSSPISQ